MQGSSTLGQTVGGGVDGGGGNEGLGASKDGLDVGDSWSWWFMDRLILSSWKRNLHMLFSSALAVAPSFDEATSDGSTIIQGSIRDGLFLLTSVSS
jgi:hypothetical protein